MKSPTSLRELHSMPGFTAGGRMRGVFGDRFASVIMLWRRKKLRSAHAVAIGAGVATTSVRAESGTCRPLGGESTWNSSDGGSTVPGAVVCS